MARYINNLKFPISDFFSFESKDYRLFVGQVSVFLKANTGESTALAIQSTSLADEMLINDSEERVSDKQNLVASLYEKRRTTYTVRHLKNNISDLDCLHLYKTFLVNYMRICTSNIPPLSRGDLVRNYHKFYNVDGFIAILNSRIDLSEILKHIEFIKNHPSVLEFDDERYLNGIIEILNKNAFFELSRAIYSIRSMIYISYFDFKIYNNDLHQLIIQPINTAQLNTKKEIFEMLSVDNISDFVAKMDKLKYFSKKRNREFLLHELFFDCVSVKDSTSKITLNKLSFPLFKYITIPIFFPYKRGLSDKELRQNFRTHRKKME